MDMAFKTRVLGLEDRGFTNKMSIVSLFKLTQGILTYLMGKAVLKPKDPAVDGWTGNLAELMLGKAQKDIDKSTSDTLESLYLACQEIGLKQPMVGKSSSVKFIMQQSSQDDLERKLHAIR